MKHESEQGEEKIYTRCPKVIGKTLREAAGPTKKK